MLIYGLMTLLRKIKKRLKDWKERWEQVREFDVLLYKLELIVEENLYCEDNKLRIKSKLKYDVVNLLDEMDKSFMDKLYKQLEYNESEED